MEVELGGSMCALDNPLVGGMQLFLIVNGALCALSAVVLSVMRVRGLGSLPPWCRTYSTAAISVHAFWAVLTLLVFRFVLTRSPDEALAFLSSLEFASVAGPSVLGLVLALLIRRRAGIDWTPALLGAGTSAPEDPHVLPHA